MHNKDFWIARADGTGAIRLTDLSDRTIAVPRFLPDASAISWISYTPETNVSILRWQSISESDPHDIVTSQKHIPYQWSPYGRRVVYWLRDDDNETTDEVFVYSLRNGETKKLLDGHIRNWAWSASGDQLAVATKEKLFVFNMLDGTQRDIEYTEEMKAVWTVSYDMKWSPDEQTIGVIFYSNDEDVTSLFTVTLLYGQWKEMTERQGSSYIVYWSPDGKWISYDLQELVKIRPAGTLWEVDIDAYVDQITQKQ